MQQSSVVVVGGGTGTHTVLRGLKAYRDKLDLTAIVTMADSGGSTGRLRDEFGQLPAGDVRNALTALAADGDAQDTLMRQLFLYRFNRGEGLDGHNFGNLFLTVLTDILGSEVAAIEAASRLLRVSGRVLPVTTDDVHLCATYADGTTIVGEHDIDEWPTTAPPTARITHLSLTPAARITVAATEALTTADLIVLGPGDLYTSVLANVVVSGFREALAASSAKIVYVCNLMSKAGQTVGLTAVDHLAEIIRYTGRAPDTMLVNSESLPADLLRTYAKAGDYPVALPSATQLGETEIIMQPLLAQEEVKTVAGDVLTRSLIRHDSAKLAAALLALVPSTQ